MRRADQFVLIGSTVPLAWLALMAVHEGGHVRRALECWIVQALQNRCRRVTRMHHVLRAELDAIPDNPD
jgi:hypothetical protein